MTDREKSRGEGKLTRPVPVTEKRFFAPECVFIFVRTPTIRCLSLTLRLAKFATWRLISWTPGEKRGRKRSSGPNLCPRLRLENWL